MPLQPALRNAVFAVVQRAGLDPADFEWFEPDVSSAVDGLLFRPLADASFVFRFRNGQWHYVLTPGERVPQDVGNAGSWDYQLEALWSWLRACKVNVEAPDLWGALSTEREALARPAQTSADEPFSPDELQAIAREMEALKAYVREAFDLSADQLREIDAKLDYLGESATRAPGRIDWWNQAVGAIITLTITGTVQPGVVQGLLSMVAHSLGHLFGGSPPQLVA